MSSPTSDASARALPNGVSVGRALWTGLRPLALLIALVVATVALTALARALATSLGFLAWRWITLGVWALGLLVCAIVYVAAMRRALRLASRAITYWALAVSAVVVLLPLILALAFPQHPE